MDNKTVSHPAHNPRLAPCDVVCLAEGEPQGSRFEDTEKMKDA